MDPDGPADRLAEELLDIITDQLRGAGFDNTVRRHYALWRAAVDDRTHPAHRLLWSHQDDTPRSRAPRRRREKPPVPSTGVEIAIAERARGVDSKAQKKFTAQARKVEALRARVKAWRDQRPVIDRELAIYQAEFAIQRGLARQFVEALDKSRATLPRRRAERSSA